MKALVYLGPRRMELQDLPEPSPAPGEVRVRMRASAICGSDLHGFREASPRRVPPLVMGHEAVGDIDAVGDEVDTAVLGSRVVAMPVVPCGVCPRCLEGRPNLCPQRRLMGMSFPGAFAEAFTIPGTQVVAMPDRLADESGALIEPLANAVHAVERSVGPGHDVLVIGAGAIGLFAARVALLDGARRAFVVDKLAQRLTLAATLGAEPLAPEEATAALAEATSGTGVDVVIDAAGLPSTWELALTAVRFGGRIEALGLGALEGPLAYQTLISKGATVTGSYACLPADFARARQLLASGDVDAGSWITRLPMSEGQSAFEDLADGAAYTKVVLVP
ncbi:MAG TPA: alcohol dehydrogenase catalytic domain-containing protein [Actinomycetota bacterium]|nr:alcohol dehydrogenase catalytic domain-containing protein [Actinomycetota bacterium]